MKILICGGAGYIGSHMVKLLVARGNEVITFDNLSTGHREAVRWGELVVGDLLDRKALAALFKVHEFAAVMHFSAKSLVGESVTDPEKYYENNVIGTANLLKEMRNAGVNHFIFSSTAATFGMPVQARIDESHPQVPINPYGRSKLMVEMMLQDYFRAYGMRSVSLRYFNAAGADPEGQLGESHDPETHLIPNVLRSILGLTAGLKVFGGDYPTADGTCVRDYIHINDLCMAHLRALDYLQFHDGCHGFNLGNGNGFSVLEVIQAAREVTGCAIPYSMEPRRPGDPPVLVADSTLARRELGWDPRYASLQDILTSAWGWHQHPLF